MTQQLPVYRVISASSITGMEITNSEGEDLGKIEAVMLDLEKASIAYVVAKFGGILGMGEKLFALPWNALTLSLHDRKLILQVPKEELKESDGFDKDNWPDMADAAWAAQIEARYAPFDGRRPVQP